MPIPVLPAGGNGTLLRLDMVADGDDGIVVVQGHRLIGKSKMQFLYIAFFLPARHL